MPSIISVPQARLRWCRHRIHTTQHAQKSTGSLTHWGKQKILWASGYMEIQSWMISVCTQFNSLWPSDAKWQQGSRSTLVQVMAWCLTAPSHCLNQCWLEISQPSVIKNQLENYFSKILLKSPRVNELIVLWVIIVLVDSAMECIDPYTLRFTSMVPEGAILWLPLRSYTEGFYG